MAEDIQAFREKCVYKAKLSEQAERYDEMADAMKMLVEKCVNCEKDELSVEERNLLSVAYKNAVGARRASWRIISSVENKEDKKSNNGNRNIAGEQRFIVEEELKKICDDILALLTDMLIVNTCNSESKVFYFKMKGDYYRYISEFSNETIRRGASGSAQESYHLASEIAKHDLQSTHPIRLGLALNYSVFHYEILNQPQTACDMAKRAFDEAITEFDNVSEESYKDSTLIMQLLRDNLTLWTSDLTQNETCQDESAGGAKEENVEGA